MFSQIGVRRSNWPKGKRMSTTTVRLRRHHSPFEKLVAEAAAALQVISGVAHAGRPNPAGGSDSIEDESLSLYEKRHSAGLMRVNHVGEVCAQALYRGQALVARREPTRRMLLESAAEEVDHLVWCDQRLQELGSRTSFLNPVWYAGSFALGLFASLTPERYNLGFMAETERQVEAHLDGHLKEIPAQDSRSRKIVVQMRDDEIKHRKTAQRHGAARLPEPVPGLMKLTSRLMTTSAYWI